MQYLFGSCHLKFKFCTDPIFNRFCIRAVGQQIILNIFDWVLFKINEFWLNKFFKNISFWWSFIVYLKKKQKISLNSIYLWNFQKIGCNNKRFSDFYFYYVGWITCKCAVLVFAFFKFFVNHLSFDYISIFAFIKFCEI